MIAKQESKKASVFTSYHPVWLFTTKYLGFVKIGEGNRQIHYLGIKSQILTSLFYLQHFISSPLTNTIRILRRVKRDHLAWKLYNVIFSFCSILLQQLRSMDCIEFAQPQKWWLVSYSPHPIEQLGTYISDVCPQKVV